MKAENIEAIILIGAGGHAHACIDVIECEGRFRIVGIVDAGVSMGSTVLGYPVLGGDDALPALIAAHKHVHIAVGQVKSVAVRARLLATVESLGALLPALVSPRAYVSRHAVIGAGTIVMHGAIVNARASVGRACIVNTGALVEHDATVGDLCHVATRAVVNGNAHIGDHCLVGSNAVVLQGVSVPGQSIVGAGAVMLRSELTPGIFVGNPSMRQPP